MKWSIPLPFPFAFSSIMWIWKQLSSTSFCIHQKYTTAKGDTWMTGLRMYTPTKAGKNTFARNQPTNRTNNNILEPTTMTFARINYNNCVLCSAPASFILYRALGKSLFKLLNAGLLYFTYSVSFNWFSRRKEVIYIYKKFLNVLKNCFLRVVEKFLNYNIKSRIRSDGFHYTDWYWIESATPKKWVSMWESNIHIGRFLIVSRSDF